MSHPSPEAMQAADLLWRSVIELANLCVASRATCIASEQMWKRTTAMQIDAAFAGLRAEIRNRAIREAAGVAQDREQALQRALAEAKLGDIVPPSVINVLIGKATTAEWISRDILSLLGKPATGPREGVM